MARTIKPEEHALKRKEILDSAQRLVFTKGYEQLTIQDILKEINISSGAFHHYFDSRGALLEAMIQRIIKESEKHLLSILHDPDLMAIQKLQGFFDTLDRMRFAQQAEVAALLRVWYADENAVIRQRVDESVFVHRAPLLAEIVQQGIREGVFTTPHPDQSGQIIMSLLQGMGTIHSNLLLKLMKENLDVQGVKDIIDRIVETHAAYIEAIERVLGAPLHSLHRTDTEAVKVWVNAIWDNQ